MREFTTEQIAQIKEIVAEVMGQNACRCCNATDTTTPRPLGVWCLTENYRAIKPAEWESKNNGEHCIGIGVVTEQTAYIVSLSPCLSLPLGSTNVTDYPAICYDKETYDNEAVTSAFLEAQCSGKEDVSYWIDDKPFPYRGCPAIDLLLDPIVSSFGVISWVLPTLATMRDIAKRIADINAAIFTVGGMVISPYYHWTCTVNQDDTECAFVVYTRNGYVDDRDMNYCNYVRAVSAFRFENFKF
ncbi:MAG: DUF1566 domain-containing protein [Alistipes sp.]|nr:DUF1566 domain-containing protein [Alistipes sp.]